MQPSFSAADEKGNVEFDDFELSEFYQEIVCKPEEDNDSDFYMNYHPAGTARFEGPHRAFPILEWMPMSFRPTKAMKLNYSVTATTAYIFQPDHAELLGREVLIKTNTGVMADRKTLKSLEPRAAVDQEIINLVVARQNWFVDPDGKKKTVWYMPTEFAQFALEAHKSVDYLRELYHDKYTRTSTYVSKMYIPMNDQGRHWYFMMVDFTERKLVWLDSLHSNERDPFRRRAILFMVNTATRMKMALLLVRSANNVIKGEVIAKAVKHWEFEKQKRDCLVKFDAV
ncbi:hypothetical protein P8452_61616 [Trifolium repens]|nr:hypothetical protein P8452_61616 [Trifolium repens]